MASPNGIGTRFGNPEKTHLALLDEPGHCANGFLDWHQRVGPVLVVEVDHDVSSSSRKLLDILRPPIDRTIRIDPPEVSELGRENNLTTFTRERLCQQFLIAPRAVRVRCIKKRTLKFNRTMHGRDRFRVIAFPISCTHTHATEADRGYFELT